MNIRRRIATVVAGVSSRSRCAVLLFAPTVGSTPISLARAFDRSISVGRQRRRADLLRGAPAARAAGALVGATLAAAGVVLQALLRNPLATPFTLGVSAGASLGAMLAIALRPRRRRARRLVGPARQLRRLARRHRHRLRARHVAAARPVDQRAAARRRDAELVLLGVDPVRAVPRRTSPQSFRAIRWLMGDLDVGSYTPDRRRAAVPDRARSRCSRCCRAR